MYGKKVKLRLTFLIVLILSLGLTIYLVLVSLKENVVYQATCKTLTKKEIRSKNVVKCLVNSYNYIFTKQKY